MKDQMTNEEVLDAALDLSAAFAHNPSVEDDAVAARATVLARMTAGWQSLPEGRERSKLGNVLIAAMYPDGRTMSDVYHDWWTFGGWARWKHPFPPTHYMVIQALPTLAEAAP